MGTGKEIRIIDLANSVNDLTGNKSGILYGERRDWDKKNRLLASIDKAKKILEYEPSVEFNQGLTHVYEWFKENFQNITNSAEF